MEREIRMGLEEVERQLGNIWSAAFVIEEVLSSHKNDENVFSGAVTLLAEAIFRTKQKVTDLMENAN